MKVFSVIPARGGSKSIPRKNILKFGGKPLIQYSIEYSLSSELVNETIVSTDDKEIAELSLLLGAKVPFIRPKNLAQDHTQDFPVFFHALKALENIYSSKIDFIILLRPTSPLRPKGLIEKAIRIISENSTCSSVRSVSKTTEHAYRQWTKKGAFIESILKGKIKENEPYNLPRQKLPEYLFQTGDIEVIRRSTLLDGSISGKNVLPIYIDSKDVHDIDSYQDLKLAEKNLR